VNKTIEKGGDHLLLVSIPRNLNRTLSSAGRGCCFRSEAYPEDKAQSWYGRL